MRVAIYARKSTESEDRQVQSLGDQLAIMQSVAEREGMTVVESFIESHSAKDPGTRTEFRRMMDSIHAGKIQGILTWHMNRLSRNMVDGGELAHLLHSGRLEVIRTPDRTFTPNDNVLMLAIENGVATSYVHDLSKAVKRGISSKADKGWFPGLAPLGYRNNIETNEIDIDPVRFPLVRRAWEMAMTGSYSLQQIHRQVVMDGLTMRGRRSTSRPLSRTYLYRMLTNRFYAGEFQHKGQFMPGKHVPVVTKGEFELVQDRLQKKGVVQVERGKVRPYAGVFRCSRCGAQVVADVKEKFYRGTSRKARYVYYRCAAHRGCNCSGVREEWITDRFAELMATMDFSKSKIEWCRKVIASEIESEADIQASAVATLQTTRSELVRRIQKSQELMIDGALEVGDYKALRLRYDADLAEVEGKLALTTSREEMVMQIISDKLKIGALIDSQSGASEGSILGRELAKALLPREALFDLENRHFDIDPLLKEIALLEPASDSSGSQDQGDLLPSNAIWRGRVQRIRTLAYELADHMLASEGGTSSNKESPSYP